MVREISFRDECEKYNFCGKLYTRAGDDKGGWEWSRRKF